MNISKVIVFIGKTGAGKSHLIEGLTANSPSPVVGISGNDLSSTTKTTTFYTINDLTLVDTPGLGDSSGNDQIFLDQFISAMQDHCNGIHRIYYVLKVHENKFDESMQNSFKVLNDMIPKFDNEVIKFILTHCDEKKNFEDMRKKWVTLFKNELKLDVTILTCGEDMLDEIGNDLVQIDTSRFIQTEFMKKVETQKQKLLNTENELKNISHIAETLQFQILDLEKKLAISDTPQDKILYLSEMVAELKKQIQYKDDQILRLQNTRHDIEMNSMFKYYELQSEMYKYRDRLEMEKLNSDLKDEKLETLTEINRRKDEENCLIS